MDIKEIALQLAHRKCTRYNHVPVDRGIRYNFSDAHLIDLAEALIAELAKYHDAPVVAYRHLMEDGWEYFDAPTGDDCPKCVPLIVKPGTKLYTIPPTAEQIANETAEAIAKYMQQSGIGGEFLAESIRSGEWRKFVKEV